MSVVRPQVHLRTALSPAQEEASVADHLAPSSYFRWKDLPGRCLALLFFVAGLPIMAATMILVRMTSRGPAIYRQVRVGLNGRIYTMYKIRTMRVDAEAGSGPVWTQLHDPRITPLGRWVRKLHLDEFPQLVNVLRGEMALIGPRPERPEFTQKLAVSLPGYLGRLKVRPGITGLAQINLPPDTDLESVRRKLAVDLAYVRQGNLSMDLRILACTSMRLFGVKGPRVTRLFGLECNPRCQSTAHHHRRRAIDDSGIALDGALAQTSFARLSLAHPTERSGGRSGSLNVQASNGRLNSHVGGHASIPADGDDEPLHGRPPLRR